MSLKFVILFISTFRMRGFMLRTAALTHITKPGRFGADKGEPGVIVSILYPVTLSVVIACKGKAKALTIAVSALKKAKVEWAGPEQYYVKNIPYTELKMKLKGLASVVDQSHARVHIKIAGPKARTLLAKGTPVDLHETEFPIGKSALTQMAHVSVHLTRTDQDEFTLSVFRGFSESFWQWLTSQAAEFGYQTE
jgi:methylglutamate dehydrogenase subunit D